jgi:hypothetical protein
VTETASLVIGADGKRYDFTLGLAAFPPATPRQRRFLTAVAADQQETDRFLGALAGIVPPDQYFIPATAARILSSRAIRQLTAATANHLPYGTRRRDRAPGADTAPSRPPGQLRDEGLPGR